MVEQKVAKEATSEQEISKQEAKEETSEQEIAKEEATEQKVTLPIVKDPKRVEAGKLSAISRAAKKRQQKLLLEQERGGEPHPSYDYKSLLYFGVPRIFLAGMFLWSTRQAKVEEFKAPEVRQQQEDQQPKQAKKTTISLFD